jgi:hypothetical protein
MYYRYLYYDNYVSLNSNGATGIYNFYFSSNLGAVFSLNWLCQDLHVVNWQISSITYSFLNKLNWKGSSKAEFQNLNFLKFRKQILKGPKPWNLLIWKAYLTLETIKQDECQSYSGSSKLLCQTKYCVHTCFKYTLVQLPLSTCCGCYHVSLCIDLYFYWKWIQ